MRVLITGGAGFIGSHLSDACLERGDEVFILDDLSTGSIDNIRHLRSQPPVPLHDRERPPCADGRRAGRPVRRRLSPRGGRRGPADRREPGPHDRDQRARDRGRAGPGQQEEEEGPDRVDLRGLWPEHPGPVQRRGQPGTRPDVEGTVELRLLEGDRRVPGAGVLAGAQAADRDRAPVQHGRSPPDRPVRHGGSHVHQAGTHRPADHHSR